MDAVILVGGQGTRLRPLTLTRHKSLVPVCNRPAIDYLFEWLAANGIDRTVLALGQANEDLAAAYPAGHHFGLDTIPIIETERLESGGAIRNAVRAAGIDSRFVVVNGDIVVDLDLRAALRLHESAGAELTLALTEVEDPSPFGVAVLDDTGVITGFVEKPPPGTAPSRLVNAGVWIFERDLVDEIPPGAVRVEETLFPSLVARRRRVLGYRFDGLWVDVGVPARYLALNHMFSSRPDAIGADVSIAPGASITGSCAGPGTTLEADARVEGSVLWERVRVGAGATVTASILANDVVVGEGAVLDGVVAGAGATFAHGPPRSTILEPGARYDASR